MPSAPPPHHTLLSKPKIMIWTFLGIRKLNYKVHVCLYTIFLVTQYNILMLILFTTAFMFFILLEYLLNNL